MGVLKSFSRFVVGSDAKDRFFLESISFIYITVSRNVISLFEISAVNLIVGLDLHVSLFSCMKKSISVLLTSHRENTSSM